MKTARLISNRYTCSSESSGKRRRTPAVRCLCGDHNSHENSDFEQDEVGGLNMLADAVLADVEVGLNAADEEWVPKGYRRKSGSKDLSANSSSEHVQNLTAVQGRRLIDLTCFFDALKSILVCKCGKAKMQLKEDISRLNCLYSALYLVCEACNHQVYLPTSRPVQVGGTKMWEVNNRTSILKNEHQLDENVLCTVFWVYDVPYVKGDSYVQLDDDTVFEDIDMQNMEYYPEHEFTVEITEEEVEEKEVPVAVKAVESPRATGSSSTKEKKSIKCTHDSDEGGSFGCLVCNDVFDSLVDLQHHTKIHIEDRPFQCSQCQETFVSQEQLKEHSKTHKFNNPVECKICGLVFKNMNVRGRHITQCHPQSRHECPDCGRYFHKPDHLVQHLRIHTGEKPYACSLCKKRFRQPSTLQKHGLLIHSAERPLKCGLCDRRFVLIQHLRQHEKTHSREKRRSMKRLLPGTSARMRRLNSTKDVIK